MLEKPIDIAVARNEQSDIGERLIWITAGAVIGVLALCGLVVLWLYGQSKLDSTLTLPLPIYPSPRLQASPSKDMQAFRDAERRRLDGSGWLDPEHRVAHIPIAAAMDIVAREGIADWPGVDTPGVATPGVATPGVATPGAPTPGAPTPGSP